MINDCIDRHARQRSWARASTSPTTWTWARAWSTGCTVVGGQDGIVTHSSMAMIIHNHVEPHDADDGHLDDRDVDGHDRAQRGSRRDAESASYCGDRSMCEIEKNVVIGTRSDSADGDKTRAGFGARGALRRRGRAQRQRLRAERRITRRLPELHVHLGPVARTADSPPRASSPHGRGSSRTAAPRTERVGHSVDHVEERGDVDRVDDRLVAARRWRGPRRRRLALSSSGRSVSFSMKPSIARSFSSTGAVRQSR